ncbi:MAG: type I restriction-modification system subunit M [Bacteriovoracaceae bacterium]|nr:type I restriction-modification system subunit M [Bacteriovoracaceae bacterium]
MAKVTKKTTIKDKVEKKPAPKKQTLADIEKTLWAAADKLRVNMDAAEYKHVVLGLIFLKYVSDSFDEFRTKLKEELKNPKHPNYFKGASEEDLEEELEVRDYFKANNVFWVPEVSRWFGNEVTGAKGIQDQAKSTKIGTIIDDAMAEIEKENPKLKNILPKDFARRQPNIRLGELVDLISTIGFNDKDMHSKDVLGHVYEYFLGQFASAEGKKGGQFYTPKSVVNLIVECLEPYEGRVYDPAMGSGGFFVSSEKFIEMHSDKDHVNDAKKKISLYGQESNPTTWRLAAMNMAIRGMDFNFGKEPADTFHKNQHPDLKADYIMANPPFNIKDWGASTLTQDRRWKYGIPSEGNANFAWVQHMIHHLGPKGYAGIVLANGSMSSNTSNEGEIRKNLLEADLVDCMIALPGQLFFNTQIPACIWILTKDKSGKDGKRNRSKEVLFIDARNIGDMIDRTQKAFSDDDLKKIAGTYHEWRKTKGKYSDVAGFCNSANLDQIKSYDYVLTPGRYVGSLVDETEYENFDMAYLRLKKQLVDLFEISNSLKNEIMEKLNVLG